MLGSEHLITSRVPTNGVSVGRKDTRVMEEGFMEDDYKS